MLKKKTRQFGIAGLFNLFAELNHSKKIISPQNLLHLKNLKTLPKVCIPEFCFLVSFLLVPEYARSHLFKLIFKYAAICKKFGSRLLGLVVWRYLLAISRNIWLCRAADIKEFPSPGKSVNSPWNTFLQNDWNNFAVEYLQKEGYFSAFYSHFFVLHLSVMKPSSFSRSCYLQNMNYKKAFRNEKKGSKI